MLQIIQKKCTNMYQNIAVIPCGIVRIGPGQYLEILFGELEGQFGVDPFFQRDAVGVVLGRGKDKAAQVQKSGIKVDFSSLRTHVLFFDFICQDFYIRETFGRYKIAKADKKPGQGEAHLLAVIVGKVKRQDGTPVVDGAKLRLKTGQRRCGRLPARKNNADNEFPGCKNADLSHIFSIVKILFYADNYI